MIKELKKTICLRGQELGGVKYPRILKTLQIAECGVEDGVPR